MMHPNTQTSNTTISLHWAQDIDAVMIPWTSASILANLPAFELLVQTAQVSSAVIMTQTPVTPFGFWSTELAELVLRDENQSGDAVTHDNYCEESPRSMEV